MQEHTYLQQLLDEQKKIEPFLIAIPHISNLIYKEITRVRAILEGPPPPPASSYPTNAPTSSMPIYTPPQHTQTHRPPPTSNNIPYHSAEKDLKRKRSRETSRDDDDYERASKRTKLARVQEKLFVPQEKYPNYNFKGRILGPRGRYLQALEAKTGCKIQIRGQGSMRSAEEEMENKGKYGCEHLDLPLHVLIEALGENEEIAQTKLAAAKHEITSLLIPILDPDQDDLKKKQLSELHDDHDKYSPTQPSTTTSPSLVAPAPQAPQAPLTYGTTNPAYATYAQNYPPQTGYAAYYPHQQ